MKFVKHADQAVHLFWKIVIFANSVKGLDFDFSYNSDPGCFVTKCGEGRFQFSEAKVEGKIYAFC